MSSRKSVITDTSSSIRKAKSDTDIAMQSLRKKAEVSLKLDNISMLYTMEGFHRNMTPLVRIRKSKLSVVRTY